MKEKRLKLKKCNGLMTHRSEYDYPSSQKQVLWKSIPVCKGPYKRKSYILHIPWVSATHAWRINLEHEYNGQD